MIYHLNYMDYYVFSFLNFSRYIIPKSLATLYVSIEFFTCNFLKISCQRRLTIWMLILSVFFVYLFDY